jgi:hypothetical protein
MSEYPNDLNPIGGRTTIISVLVLMGGLGAVFYALQSSVRDCLQDMKCLDNVAARVEEFEISPSTPTVKTTSTPFIVKAMREELLRIFSEWQREDIEIGVLTPVVNRWVDVDASGFEVDPFCESSFGKPYLEDEEIQNLVICDRFIGTDLNEAATPFFVKNRGKTIVVGFQNRGEALARDTIAFTCEVNDLQCNERFGDAVREELGERVFPGSDGYQCALVVPSGIRTMDSSLDYTAFISNDDMVRTVKAYTVELMCKSED